MLDGFFILKKHILKDIKTFYIDVSSLGINSDAGGIIPDFGIKSTQLDFVYRMPYTSILCIAKNNDDYIIILVIESAVFCFSMLQTEVAGSYAFYQVFSGKFTGKPFNCCTKICKEAIDYFVLRYNELRFSESEAFADIDLIVLENCLLHSIDLHVFNLFIDSLKLKGKILCLPKNEINAGIKPCYHDLWASTEISKKIVQILANLDTLTDKKHVENRTIRAPKIKSTNSKNKVNNYVKYHILDINVHSILEEKQKESSNIVQDDAPNKQHSTHASPCLHERRGHFRHYKSGKVVWINSTYVGDKSKGMVKKDYNIKLD